jgi:hypothetical protein
MGDTIQGLLGRTTKVIEVTLSLDTAIYADGDVLAATQEVAGALWDGGGRAIVYSITLLDKDDQGGALDLVFLKANSAIGTENAAVSVTDAAADNICGVVEIAAADYVDLINSQIVGKRAADCGFLVSGPSGSTSIYIAAISRDTKTYTAAGITLEIGLLRG